MVDNCKTATPSRSEFFCCCGERRNLCVVGDDDQGLYRFRGATIRNILEFPALFDDGQCKQVKLTVSLPLASGHHPFLQRVDEGTGVGGWNPRISLRKANCPREDDFPNVPTAVRLAASDDKDDTTNWHAEVLAFLNQMKASGQLSDWNQIAFLFRSVKNEKVVRLARFLEEQGVPCLLSSFEHVFRARKFA